MIAVTLQEAKARLNKLIQQAQAGKQVVLLRGSEIVASIQPLCSDDLELEPSLTDSQAESFWMEIKDSPVKNFNSTSTAINYIKGTLKKTKYKPK